MLKTCKFNINFHYYTRNTKKKSTMNQLLNAIKFRPIMHTNFL